MWIPAPATPASVASPHVRALCLVAISFATASTSASNLARDQQLVFNGSLLPDGRPVAEVALAALIAVAVAVMLFVTSASSTRLDALQVRGLPRPSDSSRAVLNGLMWATVGGVAVVASPEAFVDVPGGVLPLALVAALVLGAGTTLVHRVAIEYDAYRSFNLVALMLAVGSAASMSTTLVRDWWFFNFSTLGTTGDFSAQLFNAAVALAGLGIALLSVQMTVPLRRTADTTRRGGVVLMRALIITIGLCLIGVGAVPINQLTDVHNAFALAAAAAFGALVVSYVVVVRRRTRRFLVFSCGAFVSEASAMVAYDRFGIFNLTVFEIVAFGLMFVWLIAFVIGTNACPPAALSAGRQLGLLRVDAVPHSLAEVGQRAQLVVVERDAHVFGDRLHVAHRHGTKRRVPRVGQFDEYAARIVGVGRFGHEPSFDEAVDQAADTWLCDQRVAVQLSKSKAALRRS